MLIRREKCPACGNADRKVLSETSYSDPGLRGYLSLYYNKASPNRQAAFLSGGAFGACLCGACNLRYQLYTPDDDFMVELYGRWLGPNDPLAPHQAHMPLDHYSYLSQEVHTLLAFLRPRVRGRDRIRILDFGAGWGHWAEFARAYGAEVTVTELSPAKADHLLGFGFQVAATKDLESNSFDFINTEQVVEHLSNPRVVVQWLCGLLRRDGVLKLSVPDGTGIDAVLAHWDWSNAYEQRERIMPLQPLEHLNCFTSASLNRFAGQFGLERLGVPLRAAYSSLVDLDSAKGLVRAVARPIKRFVFKRGCYGLFQAKA